MCGQTDVKTDREAGRQAAGRQAGRQVGTKMLPIITPGFSLNLWESLANKVQCSTAAVFPVTHSQSDK